MKLWLDDVRPMPDGYDVHAYTASEAIKLLQVGNVTAVSLDHDLGPEEAGTGYEVACWIEQQAALGFLKPISWRIHSANPVGVEKMRTALRNANRYWQKH